MIWNVLVKGCWGWKCRPSKEGEEGCRGDLWMCWRRTWLAGVTEDVSVRWRQMTGFGNHWKEQWLPRRVTKVKGPFTLSTALAASAWLLLCFLPQTEDTHEPHLLSKLVWVRQQYTTIQSAWVSGNKRYITLLHCYYTHKKKSLFLASSGFIPISNVVVKTTPTKTNTLIKTE